MKEISIPIPSNLFPDPHPPPSPSGGSGDSGRHTGQADPKDILYNEQKIETTGHPNGHGETSKSGGK